MSRLALTAIAGCAILSAPLAIGHARKPGPDAAIPAPVATAAALSGADLLAALADPSFKVRAEALRVAVRREDVDAVPVLADRLEASHPGERGLVVDAIEAITLRSVSSPSDVRRWYREVRPRSPRERWAHGLGDPKARIRARAAARLGGCGDLRAAGDLIPALSDPASGVREWAGRGLRRLTGLDFGFDPDADEEARSVASGRWARWWAAAAVEGRRGALAEALGSEIPAARASALNALAASGDRGAMDLVLASLDDHVPGVRDAAARAGRRLGGVPLPFDPDAKLPEARLEAAAAWRAWWSAHRADLPGRE